ncbi:MAG TPA: TonB-dependent receptor, partial [Bryobacteraceae bacterium]|nr:TonB-dependent receptor [Bryobacteraceae bacterium]
LTSLYGAEYGKNLGSVINVTTRSGTNNFHGAAYEFLRNTQLNARPFFNPRRGQNVQNQFGANLGGPIRKGKTFFFGGWESTRQRNANSGNAVISKVVPTADMRAGNFGSRKINDPTTGQAFPNNVIPESRISPISAAMNKFIPLPNYSSGSTNFFASQSIPTNIDQYTARIDHRFSDKGSLYGRWFDSYEKDLAPFGQGLPGFGAWTNRKKHSATVAYTRVISPTFILEAGGAYDQTDQYKVFTDQTDMTSVGLKPLPVTMTNDGLPDIQISNYVNFGNYQRWTDHVKTATGRADITYIHGRHNLKFGVEQRNDLYSDANTLTARGRFFFTGAATGDAYADYLMGYTRNKSFGAGPGLVEHRDIVLGLYISDEWKVNNRLTITAGLRYEPYWQPATYNLGMTNFWPDQYKGIGSLENSGVVQGGVNGIPNSTVYNDMNNFMPRLGIAWRVTDKWVIRTGAGLYFDQRTGQIAQQAFGNPPVFTQVLPDCAVAGSGCSLTTPDNFTFVDPGYDPKLIPFPKSPTDSLNYAAMERNVKTDNAWQYNFTVQRELPKGMLLELGYVGTKGTHLMANYASNPLIPVNFDPSNPQPGTLVRRYPGFGNNNITGQGGSSSFNSMQATFKKRLSSGVIQAAYTWAKTISNGGDDSSRFYTSLALTPWWDWSQARGPAYFDRTHRVSVMFTQDLPRFTAAHGFVNHLANGWAVSGLLIVQSGIPLNVTNQTSGQGLGGAATDPTAALYSNVLADAPLLTSGSVKDNLNNYINKAAWSKAPYGTVGNSGRGMFRGPGQANLDFSLFKNFQVREAVKLEFRAEGFNILNHANFGNPVTSMDASNFGQINTTTVNARLVQLALKLSF